MIMEINPKFPLIRIFGTPLVRKQSIKAYELIHAEEGNPA